MCCSVTRIDVDRQGLALIDLDRHLPRPDPTMPALPANAARPSPATIAFDVLAAGSADAAQIQARQAQRLAALLEAARATRFYREVYCQLNRGTFHGQEPGSLPLTALPVTNKSGLMACWADHVADPRIALDGLRAFCADPARIGQRFLDRWWVWESSGSSGEPGIFVQDATAMAVYDALEGLRRQSPRPWARLVDPLFLGERIAFVGAIDGHFASHVSVRRLCAATPWLAPQRRSFSILQPTAALVDQLNGYQPSIVATYPTAAALLADEARHGRLVIHAQEVWTGGETLTPANRSRIEHGLGCALRNSYGSSEFLPIAWECGHGSLHVNADWVILEAVDAQHRPVQGGQVSHTTLLTNLANHVQPLIRFDIGDRIRFMPQPCACGSALPVLQVQGRRDDALTLPGRDGRPVTLLPLALSTVLEDQAGVFDFQLRQHAPAACCLLLGPGAAATPALRARCRQVLGDFAAAQGAAGLRVSVRQVAALPTGTSGKRKRIVALPAATIWAAA
jgi:phenylacetate-coenzyme A ligase PaaK-like adenylate-forming protein